MRGSLPFRYTYYIALLQNPAGKCPNLDPQRVGFLTLRKAKQPQSAEYPTVPPSNHHGIIARCQNCTLLHHPSPRCVGGAINGVSRIVWLFFSRQCSCRSSQLALERKRATGLGGMSLSADRRKLKKLAELCLHRISQVCVHPCLHLRGPAVLLFHAARSAFDCNVFCLRFRFCPLALVGLLSHSVTRSAYVRVQLSCERQ